LGEANVGVLASKMLFLEGFKGLASGELSPTSSVSSANSLVSKELFEETLGILFTQADTDNSGELSYTEVKDLSSSMGLFMDQTTWARIFKEMDTDGNGSISKPELVTFWRNWFNEKGPGATLKSQESEANESTKATIPNTKQRVKAVGGGKLAHHRQTQEKIAQAKPAQAKPAQAKPSQAKPAQANPAQAKPAQVKPAQAKPAQAKPDTSPSKQQAKPYRSRF